MFSFEQLEQVQVEITNRCQASCPMCLRNIHGGIENPSLKLTDWTLDQFKHIFNYDVLNQIKHINFCGDFGDPIINSDLLEMCRYLKEYSSISVTIHTNGSARSIEWWELLARALPTDHKVEFALDGLNDTHALYRTGTDYDTIIRNAIAFMEAGGKAHWMYIKFKHNEHQVETACNLATTLGFKSFTVKNSKRFGKQFPVLNRTGEVTHYIEQPTTSSIQPVEFVDLKDYKSWNSKINCFTLNDKELYIDAQGHVLPCCLIGSFLYANYNIDLYNKYNLIDSMSVVGIANEVQSEVFNTIEELGGLQVLDANTHSIKDIMSTNMWQTLIQQKWTTNSSAPCTILCGSKSPFISIADQINRDT
jgi:MoaA/NifB/PqqE/SkfB family radical SAM enzyme